MFRKDNLVYYDIVSVNLKLCQLLNKALCLVQRQELRNAYANEGGQIGVLELTVNLLDHSLWYTISSGQILEEDHTDPLDCICAHLTSSMA